MRFKLQIVTVFLFTLVFGLFFTKTAKIAFADTFQLSGTVKDNAANIVVGATVDVYTHGNTTDIVSPATTDQNGSYSFTAIPSGLYDVKVTPPSGSNLNPITAV